MGIYINLVVSKSVTKEEWKKAYEETLQLVAAFPLAECRRELIHGIEILCLAPTKERGFQYGFYKNQTGWCAEGDMVSMAAAEEFILIRDLVKDESYDPDAGDAILGIVPDEMLGEYDITVEHVYHLWGGKTQGEIYHIFLLAIACLLESRLGNRVFILGDITKGQCEAAVEAANEILENKIDVPDRCYPEKLYERIRKLHFTEIEQLEILDSYYLGNHDEEFGHFIRSHFAEEIWRRYWKNLFDDTIFNSFGFDKLLVSYLEGGFDLGVLCSIIDGRDQNGNEVYDEFITLILDTKVYLEERDLRDVLHIDQDERKLYTVDSQFAQVFFGGVCKKRVNRFISIEEIRKTFLKAFSDQCDVNQIIDRYLEEEAGKQDSKMSEGLSEEEFDAAFANDPAGHINDWVDRRRERLSKARETYDIYSYEGLINYSAGDTISPDILEEVEFDFKCYDDFNDDTEFQRLLSQDAHSRCEWLAETNKYLLLRNIDWEKIFSDIETNPDSFRRYYPLVKCSSVKFLRLVKAVVVNDDFYVFCKGLVTES